MTTWMPIQDFEDYLVSDEGEVRHGHEGRKLSLQVNQQGIVNVGLTRDREQHKVSVARLVAHAFLPEQTNPNFDTPIHLDGHRTNCAADNLMWRPRWFAVRYHRQFHSRQINYDSPIYEVENHHKFANSMEAAMRYGLLAEDVFYAVVNGGHVFPTYQHFRDWEE